MFDLKSKLALIFFQSLELVNAGCNDKQTKFKSVTQIFSPIVSFYSFFIKWRLAVRLCRLSLFAIQFNFPKSWQITWFSVQRSGPEISDDSSVMTYRGHSILQVGRPKVSLNCAFSEYHKRHVALKIHLQYLINIFRKMLHNQPTKCVS